MMTFGMKRCGLSETQLESMMHADERGRFSPFLDSTAGALKRRGLAKEVYEHTLDEMRRLEAKAKKLALRAAKALTAGRYWQGRTLAEDACDVDMDRLSTELKLTKKGHELLAKVKKANEVKEEVRR